MNPVQRLLSLALLAIVEPVAAQHGGFIAGRVRDRSGGIVPGAEIRLQNDETGARQKAYCDADGKYFTSELVQGAYKITVRNEGFRTITQSGVAVSAGETRLIDFVIDVLPLQQEVTVEADRNDQDPTANGLTVSRQSSANSLPANGRDLHALFSIMPGATITPASIGDGGQFTVGGQRPNTNSFRIDGVSGNAGIGVISIPGSFPGGTLPAMTTIGSTQALASKEETQRVELRSSDFVAESGDRPGAQIAIETRSGSNEFHGSAFGYIRPHLLNAQDWFSQSIDAGLPSASLNGWGGSFGGPIWRNHTFFFTSFERADVHDSATQVIPVPSAEARSAAGPAYQVFLNAFQFPTSRTLNSTESLGISGLQKNGTISNVSFRLDQALGTKVQFFARYSDVPSSSTTFELGTAFAKFRWLSATAGLNIATTSLTQQIRFNYSQAAAVSMHGSASDSDRPDVDVIDRALSNYFFPSLFNVEPTPPSLGYGEHLTAVPFYPGWQVTELSIAGVGQAISGQSGQSTQHQWEGAYNIAKNAGRHDFRAGGDYVRLMPNDGVFNGTLSVVSPGISALLAGDPLGVTISSFPLYGPIIQKTSLFAQDTFRVSERLNVLLGLRWELTNPFNTYYRYPSSYFPYVGYWNGLGTDPRELGGVYLLGGSRWPMRYRQFEPRIGLGYHLKAPDVVLRAGAGIFYDTGLGSSIDSADVNPLNSWQFAPTAGVSNTAAASAIAPTPAPSSVLYLPRVLEWRTSLEKSIHSGALLSVSYLGSTGSNLLRKEASVAPGSGLLQSLAFTSHGNSNYQALQAQFAGNITSRVYALISYSWAHSIDTGSSNTGVFLVQPGYKDAVDRGSSSFDVRHTFSASFGYRLPSSALTSFWRPLLGGWNLSFTIQARTGFPVDVTTVDRSIGLGFDNTGRPDLVTGVLMWIANSMVPGGRELNPAAFRAAAAGMHGTLGRNVLTGAGLFQIDASLCRQFRLYRGSSLEASVSAFNTLNHPAFSNPVSYLSSPLFGQPTSMANLMLGSGSPTTGLTPIFQAGGPRTIELGLRFTF